MKEEKRMLGGWRKAAIVGGVLALLLGAAEALLLQRWDLAGDCAAGSLGLFLLSGVLEWMGEIESHLRSIKTHMATSADRLVRMERMMDAGTQAESGIDRQPQNKAEDAWSKHETVQEKPEKMEMDDAIRMANKLKR